MKFVLQTFHRAGAAEPHAGNYFGQVVEVHCRVGHYAEHKIVVADNFEGGVELAVFCVNFFAEEKRGVWWRSPVGGQVQLVAKLARITNPRYQVLGWKGLLCQVRTIVYWVDISKQAVSQVVCK